MARLMHFVRKSRADRRMLAHAGVLYAVVAVAVRVLPFGRVRRILGRIAALGPRPRGVENADARVVQAVRTVASVLPGANCLIDALVAQCLLARYQCETTLCFGVSRIHPAGRPFDAHAWLERGGSGLIGSRAIDYDPLRHPSRCVPSPSSL